MASEAARSAEGACGGRAGERALFERRGGASEATRRPEASSRARPASDKPHAPSAGCDAERSARPGRATDWIEVLREGRPARVPVGQVVSLREGVSGGAVEGAAHVVFAAEAGLAE